ncbi:hypothetical protein B296_00052508, partial [Ensete ventricosum]
PESAVGSSSWRALPALQRWRCRAQKCSREISFSTSLPASTHSPPNLVRLPSYSYRFCALSVARLSSFSCSIWLFRCQKTDRRCREGQAGANLSPPFASFPVNFSTHLFNSEAVAVTTAIQEDILLEMGIG